MKNKYSRSLNCHNNLSIKNKVIVKSSSHDFKERLLLFFRIIHKIDGGKKDSRPRMTSEIFSENTKIFDGDVFFIENYYSPFVFFGQRLSNIDNVVYTKEQLIENKIELIKIF